MEIVNGDTTYQVEESFVHFDTKETMYRVKRIYSSGVLDFIVLNEDHLNKLKEGMQV